MSLDSTGGIEQGANAGGNGGTPAGKRSNEARGTRAGIDGLEVLVWPLFGVTLKVNVAEHAKFWATLART